MNQHIVNSLDTKSALWPKKFNNLYLPPKNLFVRGKLTHTSRVAIVGTRRPTQYGAQATRVIAGDLARAGITIVSGLALGIDSIAHTAALDAGGSTIAVLPASVEHIYPRRHQQLARRILASSAPESALVSEHASVQAPRKEDFIARNRLVAGLADMVVVTEAAIQSGTAHTVRFALELGVDIGAVPNTIFNTLGAGAHHIIRQGGAVITSADDVMHELGYTKEQADSAPYRQLSEQQQQIAKCILKGHTTTASIGHEIDNSGSQIAQDLTEMELAGIIARSANGVYYLR